MDNYNWHTDQNVLVVPMMMMDDLYRVLTRLPRSNDTVCIRPFTTSKWSVLQPPRSIRRGRKRPFLIVFDSFGSDRITAVFHRIVNERKRSDTPFSGRLRQLLTVYDTTKNGRNTITTKWAIYTP